MAGPPQAGVHGDAQTDSPLLPQIIDLTTELSDERYKGDVACQVLDGERAERLRGARELQELQVGEPRAVGLCWWWCLPLSTALLDPSALETARAAPFLPWVSPEQTRPSAEETGVGGKAAGRDPAAGSVA